jgi:hypothetical protein
MVTGNPPLHPTSSPKTGTKVPRQQETDVQYSSFEKGEMRMNKRMLVFALIAVFAAVLAGGCSDTEKESIEYFIRDYYSAYNAEDWEQCLGHIDDTNNVGAATIESVLKMARAATGEVTVESVANVNVTGATATADVKISYGGQSETREYPLVKKDGSWKISWQ